jgi:hypothetical protein
MTPLSKEIDKLTREESAELLKELAEWAEQDRSVRSDADDYELGLNVGYSLAQSYTETLITKKLNLWQNPATT